MGSLLHERCPEPEAMDLAEEAVAYADADFSVVNDAFVERWVEYMSDGVGKNVVALDLGTGPGDIPIRLLRRCPYWKVAAVDVSVPMLSLCRKAMYQVGLEGSIWPVCLDAKLLPFPCASFDIVFSNSILHHVADVEAFWLEIKRIARAGAFVFVRDLIRPATVEDAAHIVETYAGAESSLLQEEYYRSLLAAYTTVEMETQLRQAGLVSLRVQQVTDRHADIFGWV